MSNTSQTWLFPALLACLVGCGSSNNKISQIGDTEQSGGASSGASGDSTGYAASGGLELGNADSAAAGAAGASEPTCGGTVLAASPKIVNVLLVVDKSSSMTATPAGFGDNKWNGLRSALSSALDATSGKVSFGLDFFPSSGDASVPLQNGCALPASGEPAVPVAAGAATITAIKKALTDNSPAGATPTAAALGRALAYFTKGAGAALAGEHYVLLATDGGPNCDDSLSCAAAACTVNMDGLCPAGTNCCDPKLDPQGPGKCLDDGATLSMVKALAKANVKTFVVGIPGTEAYGTTLDSLATEGGESNPNAPPAYFAVSASGGVKALSQVLTKITTGLITSCDLVLAQEPPDLDQINVVIDGKTILEGDVNGWSVDQSTSPPTIVLKGSTCAAVTEFGAENLSVTFGCPTEHVK